MRERIAAAEAESAAAAGAAAAPVPPEESSEAEGAAAAVTAPAQLDIPRMSPETPTTTDSGFKESAPAAARGRGRAGLISRLKSIQMGQERPVPVEGIAQPTPEFSTPSPPLFSTSSSGTPAAPVVRRGKEGSPLQCTANYLQLELRQGGGVFEYEVKFNPHVDGIVERRRCVLQHEQIIGKAFNFNGTVLYLPIKLAENVSRVFYSNLLFSRPIQSYLTLANRGHFGDLHRCQGEGGYLLQEAEEHHGPGHHDPLQQPVQEDHEDPEILPSEPLLL